ncbi:MAG: hypothetical protein HUJ25_17235 [Crocinitomicaceae bacterium]|nr:hypothetical protein [Crocinitomicaceae bacterium]
MEITESVKIIERMMNESKKTLHNYSAYFIIWGMVMAPAGIAEYLLIDYEYRWIVWPIASIIGGVLSAIVGNKQSKKQQASSAMDRVIGYTWGAFGFCLILAIAYAVSIQKPPHTLVLMLAGGATFISGGISKFKPFIYGGLALELAAIACAFFIPGEFHSLIFAVGILLGYIIPGFILRNIENE